MPPTMQIAYETGLGQYGTTLTVTPSITAGSTYYIRVAGADTSAMGTGNYAITINTGTGASPTVPLPNTQVAGRHSASHRRRPVRPHGSQPGAELLHVADDNDGE